MIIVNLVQNIALLVALATLYQVVGARLKQANTEHRILSGLLFGGAGVVGMLTPVTVMPGIIFDGRSIILSVAGLFGGPVIALIAAVICSAYRLWLGGAGAWVGVASIVLAASLGVVFHVVRQRSDRSTGALSLWAFGLLVQLASLAPLLALPGGAGPQVLRQVALPILIVYPLATMLVCQIFLDYERQALDRQALHASHAALRASEEQHRILLDESSDPIFSFAPEGRYLYVNRAFAEGVGKPCDRIIGYRMWDVFPKEEADKRFAALSQVFQTGEEKVIEVRVPRADGDRFYITTITPIKDAQGRVTTVICSSKDITARKRAEAEREAALEALGQKVQDLERFNRITVDRELRMIEMKQEVNALLRQAGQPEKYRIVA